MESESRSTTGAGESGASTSLSRKLKAEKRRQRILAKGRDRLAFITGQADASSAQPVATHEARRAVIPPCSTSSQPVEEIKSHSELREEGRHSESEATRSLEGPGTSGSIGIEEVKRESRVPRGEETRASSVDKGAAKHGMSGVPQTGLAAAAKPARAVKTITKGTQRRLVLFALALVHIFSLYHFKSNGRSLWSGSEVQSQSAMAWFVTCEAVLFLAIGVDKGLGGSTIASYICRALRLHWPLSIAEDLAFYLFVIIVAAKGTQVA